MLDSNDDNIVQPPGEDAVRKSVIVWSRGDPSKDGYNKPEKWIKSWL
jgi:hypothetical protein